MQTNMSTALSALGLDECDPLGVTLPSNVTPRETEKARLVALILSPEESDTVKAQAAEELFALGRLVELDYQLSKIPAVGRRQAG